MRVVSTDLIIQLAQKLEDQHVVKFLESIDERYGFEIKDKVNDCTIERCQKCGICSD